MLCDALTATALGETVDVFILSMTLKIYGKVFVSNPFFARTVTIIATLMPELI